MPRKKETLYYTHGYKPEITQGLDDLTIIVAGCEMIYKEAKLVYAYGLGELYVEGKLVFRSRKQPNSVMVASVRDFILSQLTQDQYEELEKVDNAEMKANNYNDFFVKY